MELVKTNDLDQVLELRKEEKERKERLAEERRKKAIIKYSMDCLEESYGYTLSKARDYLLNNIPIIEV